MQKKSAKTHANFRVRNVSLAIARFLFEFADAASIKWSKRDERKKPRIQRRRWVNDNAKTRNLMAFDR